MKLNDIFETDDPAFSKLKGTLNPSAAIDTEHEKQRHAKDTVNPAIQSTAAHFHKKYGDKNRVDMKDPELIYLTQYSEQLCKDAMRLEPKHMDDFMELFDHDGFETCMNEVLKILTKRTGSEEEAEHLTNDLANRILNKYNGNLADD